MPHETEPSLSPQKPSSLWGLLGILVSAVAVWFFSKPGTLIEQSADSIYRDDSSDQSRKDSDNYSTRGIGTTKTDCPPSPSECRYPEKKRKRWWKRWKPYVFLLNIVTFIAVAVYACITYKMWHEMRKQTTMQSKIYENTQRPRLGIDGRPVITKPIEVSGESGHRTAQIQTALYVKNFGTQPAMHVGFHEAILTTPNIVDTKDYEAYLNSTADMTCKMADLSTKGNKGPYIFPNNTHFELVSNGFQEGQKDGFSWEFKMVGCISYWDEVGNAMRHTRFCFKSASRIDTITQQTFCMPAKKMSTQIERTANQPP